MSKTAMEFINLNKKIVTKVIVGTVILVLTITALLIINNLSQTNSFIAFERINLHKLRNYLPKPFVVQSGSMEPAIKTASVVFSVPRKTYSPGDIITFSPNGNGKTLVTHRIEFKQYPNGLYSDPVYLTSGDANNNFDRWQVTNDQIVGKVLLSIPYFGYLVNLAKNPQGFIILVVIPATIIIYEELKSLKKELSRLATKLRGKKPAKRNPLIDQTPHRKIVKITRLIPIIGSAIVFISISSAYFFDTETSIGNALSAKETFSSVAINEFVVNSDPEWVEFYNASPSADYIKSYYFDDDTDFASDIGNSTITPLTSLHTSNSTNPFIEITTFLDNDSGFVVLFDASGRVADLFQYFSDPGSGMSIGRETDGTGDWQVPCSAPSKGVSNNGSC